VDKFKNKNCPRRWRGQFFLPSLFLSHFLIAILAIYRPVAGRRKRQGVGGFGMALGTFPFASKIIPPRRIVAAIIVSIKHDT
jgi:hypothetical protein